MSRDHSQNHYGPNASFDGYDSDLASAGILIESLRQQLSAAYEAGKRDVSEDLEQAAFEKWLYDKCPSGDVESVQRQWLKSYEYAEFAGKLEQAAQIDSLQQQLAAALAVCKQKDEALKWLMDWQVKHVDVWDNPAFDNAEEALTIQPDDSALKAWIGEPLLCREDGRCQYAIDHGAEGMGHCPEGKCCMPRYSPKGLK